MYVCMCTCDVISSRRFSSSPKNSTVTSSIVSKVANTRMRKTRISNPSGSDSVTLVTLSRRCSGKLTGSRLLCDIMVILSISGNIPSHDRSTSGVSKSKQESKRIRTQKLVTSSWIFLYLSCYGLFIHKHIHKSGSGVAAG